MKKIFTLSFGCFLLMMGMASAQTHIWGVCGMGGTHGIGTIFMADSNGNNFTTVYSFDSAHGQDPLGNLTLAPNGKIYGVCALDTCIADRIMFEYDPITHTNLDVFDFYSNYNRCWTLDGMILGIDGNLYGLSISGGTYNDGLIYRFHPDTHVFDTLYNFDTLTGMQPSGRLLQVNNKLYGTTSSGGAFNEGVIFCFDLSSLTYTDLHDFNLTEGANPDFGSLIIGSDGKLYGTAPNGGTNSNGVIFSYDTSANIYSVIHYFDSTHGSNPYGKLIQATNGKLYGMTYIGGLNDFGVIYSYDLSDSTFSDVYDFDHLYGENPDRELMQASNGLLFGTTFQGGAIGAGVFFSYNYNTSTYTVLHNFDNGVNGGGPVCDIVELPDYLTTGINPIPNKESISIYPNPATTTLTLHSQLSIPNSQFIVSDVTGREIYHQPLNNSIQTTIDVSDWSNGVYFYQLTNNKETYRGKFVKE